MPREKKATASQLAGGNYSFSWKVIDNSRPLGIYALWAKTWREFF
jgi:hypothetical protein